MASVDIEWKRLDSLSRNRASAELKKRYPEEWEELRRKIHNELRVERELLGEVTRNRTRLKHQDSGDGTCEECGHPVPCRTMRRRDAEKSARVDQPVNTDDDY